MSAVNATCIAHNSVKQQWVVRVVCFADADITAGGQISGWLLTLNSYCSLISPPTNMKEIDKHRKPSTSARFGFGQIADTRPHLESRIRFTSIPHHRLGLVINVAISMSSYQAVLSCGRRCADARPILNEQRPPSTVPSHGCPGQPGLLKVPLNITNQHNQPSLPGCPGIVAIEWM